MDQTLLSELGDETEGLRESGLYKDERVIATPQGAAITVADGPELNFFFGFNALDRTASVCRRSTP